MPKGADDLTKALVNDDVAKLIEIAISLHDHEVLRRERWKSWLPIAAAIIAGLFSIAVAIFKTDNAKSTADDTPRSAQTQHAPTNKCRSVKEPLQWCWVLCHIFVKPHHFCELLRNHHVQTTALCAQHFGHVLHLRLMLLSSERPRSVRETLPLPAHWRRPAKRQRWQRTAI
jgi:hypothetical protein